MVKKSRSRDSNHMQGPLHHEYATLSAEPPENLLIATYPAHVTAGPL